MPSRNVVSMVMSIVCNFAASKDSLTSPQYEEEYACVYFVEPLIINFASKVTAAVIVFSDCLPIISSKISATFFPNDARDSCFNGIFELTTSRA
jgi:hypothetical protein